MARVTLHPQETPVHLQTSPNGRAAAALLAAGIGCLALGALSVLSSVFDPLSEALKFYGLADDISGVSTLAIAAWLLSWFLLHRRWKQLQVHFPWVLAVTLLLIALGLLG